MMRIPVPNLIALGLICMGLGAPFEAFAVTTTPCIGIVACSSHMKGWIYKVKFMPPSGPREDCFGRCRRDVTRCKNYAQQTSTNDQMLRDWLNSCDITNRQCRATCEPLKNNPQ
jgi:hypothetical protein